CASPWASRTSPTSSRTSTKPCGKGADDGAPGLTRTPRPGRAPAHDDEGPGSSSSPGASSSAWSAHAQLVGGGLLVVDVGAPLIGRVVGGADLVGALGKAGQGDADLAAVTRLQGYGAGLLAVGDLDLAGALAGQGGAHAHCDLDSLGLLGLLGYGNGDLG